METATLVTWPADGEHAHQTIDPYTTMEMDVQPLDEPDGLAQLAGEDPNAAAAEERKNTGEAVGMGDEAGPSDGAVELGDPAITKLGRKSRRSAGGRERLNKRSAGSAPTLPQE